MFNPADYINEWDSIIDNWMKDPNVLTPLREGNLSEKHLPEPYYGDIDNCSIVIINLNPGEGMDYQHWNNRMKQGTDINEAMHKKYSGFAKSFPLLNGNTPSAEWWKQRRIRWISRILEIMGIKTDKNPFAIELCPLHSKDFKINALNYVDHLKKVNPKLDVIEVIKIAIKSSDAKIGLATGKPIYELLSTKGFKDIKKGSIPDNCREYRIVEKDEVRILCTWYQGGHYAPGAKFIKIEKSLLQNL